MSKGKHQMDYFLDERDGIWTVNERSTEQVIKAFDNQKEAIALLRHLNLGGGFAGDTPPFFLKDFTGLLNSFKV